VLVASLANSSLQVLAGNHVLEVRVHGIDKGLVVRKVLDHQRDTAMGAPAVIAMGDDTTDEDMFAALPDDALSIHVGERESRAHYRVADPHAARRLLWALVAARKG